MKSKPALDDPNQPLITDDNSGDLDMAVASRLVHDRLNDVPNYWKTLLLHTDGRRILPSTLGITVTYDWAVLTYETWGKCMPRQTISSNHPLSTKDTRQISRKKTSQNYSTAQFSYAASVHMIYVKVNEHRRLTQRKGKLAAERRSFVIDALVHTQTLTHRWYVQMKWLTLMYMSDTAMGPLTQPCPWPRYTIPTQPIIKHQDLHIHNCWKHKWNWMIFDGKMPPLWKLSPWPLNAWPSKFLKCLSDHICSHCDPELWPFDLKLSIVHLCAHLQLSCKFCLSMSSP